MDTWQWRSVLGARPGACRCTARKGLPLSVCMSVRDIFRDLGGSLYLAQLQRPGLAVSVGPRSSRWRKESGVTQVAGVC